MAKHYKLIGTTFKEFQDRLGSSCTQANTSEIKDQIYGQRARLIPIGETTKNGCEKNLASIFLSTMTMVKEFREMVSKEIDLKKGGSLYAYTEVAFPFLPIYYNHKDRDKKELDRVDGLLLVVTAGKISDAAFFEMKSNSAVLDRDQIEHYISLAQEVGIDKMVTVSNQFVTSSTYSPLDIKVPSGFKLFHLSWHYINTMGKILWEDNETNIDDQDQRAIMYEVSQYFDHDKSGVRDFSATTETWGKAIDGLLKNTVNPYDSYCSGAVLNWIQEERDIALKLSQHLGYVIDTQKKKYSTLQERITDETQTLLKTLKLQSEFKIKHVVSNLRVEADIHGTNICVSVVVKNPEGATTYSQLKFVKNQLEKKCAMKNPDKFKSMEKDITLEVAYKGRIPDTTFNYQDYDEFEYRIKELGKEKDASIKQVRVNYIKNYGLAIFKSRTKFIKTYEEQILTFYHVIVQNIKNGVIAAPQIENLEIEE